MKRIAKVFRIVCACAAISASATPQPTNTAPTAIEQAQTVLPSAAVLRHAVISHLPQKAVTLKGRLTGQCAGTDEKFALNVTISLKADGERVNAVYQAFDAFGVLLGTVRLDRDPGAAPRFTYQAGLDGAVETDPDLFRTIGTSDTYWIDLALGFLWWTRGQTIGRQETRGRDCFVADYYTPRPDRDQYSSVRLWIDQKVGMFLQAEAFDRAGTLARRVIIKSFKKIGEDWMVKDIELRSMPSGRKTFLRIDELTIDGVKPADAAPEALESAQ